VRVSRGRRLIAGDQPPAVEVMLWHYAKGKPKDQVEVLGATQGPLVISWLPARRPATV
jgi:hypothetical protein